MSGRRLAVVPVILLAVLLAGCSDDAGDETAAPDPTTTSSTSTTSTTVTFTGDPDSEFCRLVVSSEDRPVLDPFEAGLDPAEVKVRFLSLRLRFDEFAAAAPAELADDLDELVSGLDTLEQELAAAGYDFAVLAESGADVSGFDDESFADTAVRIAAYRQQVC